MKTSKYYVLLFILLLFCCCNSNKDGRQGIINLKNVKEKTIKISSLADSIYYIKLETTNECLIKNIQQLYLDKDMIFINDDFKRLLVFNRIGKYINQIGRIGKGPGEYTAIHSFSVDSINRIVYVLDGRQILGYNYQGVYNDIQIKTNTCINLFCNKKLFYCYTPKELFFNSNSNNFKINILDSSGARVNAFLPVSGNTKLPMFISLSDFYSVGNEVFLLDPDKNIVYKVDDKNITVKYEFVYGNQKDIDNSNENDQFEYGEQNNIDDKDKLECRKILENVNYILIYYRLGKVSNLAYIDLRDNSISNVKTKGNIVGFENDITDDLPILPGYIFDNFWVDVIQPSDIIERFKNNNYEEKTNGLYNISIEDNPIIRICRLKK